MHPAYSRSVHDGLGCGFGLLVWFAVFGLLGLVPTGRWRVGGFRPALFLIAAGLPDGAPGRPSGGAPSAVAHVVVSREG
jgi:hypothetical protein